MLSKTPGEIGAVTKSFIKADIILCTSWHKLDTNIFKKLKLNGVMHVDVKVNMKY